MNAHSTKHQQVQVGWVPSGAGRRCRTASKLTLCYVALTTFVLPGAVFRNKRHRRSHCASAHNGSQQGF